MAKPKAPVPTEEIVIPAAQQIKQRFNLGDLVWFIAGVPDPAKEALKGNTQRLISGKVTGVVAREGHILYQIDATGDVFRFEDELAFSRQERIDRL